MASIIEKETEKKNGGWFEALFGATEAVINAIKKPQYKRALRRRFESAYDDLNGKIIDAENKISEFRLKFEDFKLNEVLELKRQIKSYKEAQDSIKEEYNEAFGKNLDVRDDD